MKGSWRGLWATAVTAAVVSCPAPALAAHEPAPRSESLSASGAITIAWSGDPARGCAAEGLCDVHGALILGAVGDGQLTTFGGHSMVFVGASITTRVIRDQGGSPAGECVDVPTTAFGGQLQLELVRSGGGLVARLQQAPSSGSCAGPLASDLAAAALPAKETGHARPTIDLRGSRAFAAGPFSGTVQSTLILRPVSQQSGGSSGSFFGSSSGPPSHRHRRFLERVDLRYRLAAAPAGLEFAFTGAGDPSCLALDSCGGSGSLALSLPARMETLAVSASRVVRTPVGRRRALADLREGRLHLSALAVVPMAATVSESFDRPGVVPCADSAAESGLELTLGSVNGPERGARVPLELVDQGGADFLRTHCPGPTGTEMTGPSDVVAGASLSRGQLLSPRTIVSLSNEGGFTGLGYAGTRSGTVELTLTLVAAKAGTTAARPR